MRKSVYLSSTFEDLRAHREGVSHALKTMGYDVHLMEEYAARNSSMLDFVRSDVGNCDFYVGIFAWRYGYVPREGNPDGMSVTELEYREAVAKQKPRVVFLLDRRADWPAEFKDTAMGENESGARINRLRQELAELMHTPFIGTEDLNQSVLIAMHLAEVDVKAKVLSSDLSNASCLTMTTSEAPEIIDNIKQAIAEHSKASVIKINLGTGKSWWSTRLHLLSALCAEYTDVQRLLFEADGYRFVGMCSPVQARRVLARTFPAIENAYRASMPLPEKMSFDPAADVQHIVDRFSQEMDALGGEQIVKDWVAPHVIENWGVNKDFVDILDVQVTKQLLDDVLSRPSPFVVITRDGEVKRIVDRLKLATLTGA